MLFPKYNTISLSFVKVEALQEGISRLKSDIREAKGRGEERERLQREQMTSMDRKLTTSTHEADSAETKLNLMEGEAGGKEPCKQVENPRSLLSEEAS